MWEVTARPRGYSKSQGRMPLDRIASEFPTLDAFRIFAAENPMLSNL